jgi:hypothetical protein
MSLAESVVISLPLEKIGRAIRDGYELTKRGNSEWVQGSLDVAAAMYMARQHFTADRTFGAWLKSSGYNYYKPNERAALVAMGSDIPTMRDVLNKRVGNSYRYIYERAKSRFPYVVKPEEAVTKSAKRRRRSKRKPPRKHTKTSKEMKMAFRIAKIGEGVYERIKGSSLDQPRELDALFKLGDAPTDVRNGHQGGFDPARVEALVMQAEQGEAVSAAAKLAECSKTPPVTPEELLEGWKHCRLLPLWLRANRKVRQTFVDYLTQHIGE